MRVIRCWSAAIGILLFILRHTNCNDEPPNPVIKRLKSTISQDLIKNATRPLNEEYIYVDKTKFVLQLLRDNNRYFFARPGRFGKTVFLRTLQAVFQGRKEIFKGTDIYNDKGYLWEKFPVMYFDLSAPTVENAFNQELTRFQGEVNITEIPKECAITLNNSTYVPPEIIQFTETLCVTHTFKGLRTVILIDAYDHHILSKSNNTAAIDQNENFMALLFQEIKRMAVHIEFAFVTGITECSFASGYPGGDLTDITRATRYGELAGFTKTELKKYFADHIKHIADERKVPEEYIENELKEWYDGYAFTVKMESLYNPLSVECYFRERKAGVYWAREGPASFLWDQMKVRPKDFSDIAPVMVSTLRDEWNTNRKEPEILLYEAGYFTIGEIRMNTYTGADFILRFANKEVRTAFYEELVEAAKYAKKRYNIKHEIETMTKAIGLPVPDFNTFMAAADTAISKLPFRFTFENDCQQILYFLMRECNIDPIPGNKTKEAHMDITAESSHTLMHFELKMQNEGMKRVGKKANRSIRNFSFQGKNILTAEILFHKGEREFVIYGWSAELRSPNGTHIIKKFSHKESEGFRAYTME